MSDRASKFVSKAGEGRQGYCKLCAFADVAKLNKNIAAGWNSRQINDWLRENYNVTVTRQTFYNHRDNHAKNPQDRLVTAVQKAQAKGVVLPATTSTEEFLGAVRDTAMRRAIENPEEVTIDHGLKAAQILASQKKSGGDIHILLAKIVTGSDWRSGVVIEGEAVEVTQ